MRTTAIEWKTMIVSIWLAIRMIDVNHHRDLEKKPSSESNNQSYRLFGFLKIKLFSA